MNGAAPTSPAARDRAELLWSDCWYLAATAVALVVAIDPLEWGLAAGAAKHLALAVALPALALTLAGSGLAPPSRRTVPLAALTTLLWPLLLLGSFVLAGSAYARVVRDIQNSFLNVGLYMMTAGIAATMVVRTSAPEALVRAHLRLVLAGAVVMAACLIVNFRVRQVYHEQIFLVIPMAVLLFAGRATPLVRWAGCLFFLLMAWLSEKYTSYLIGAMTVAYLALVVAVPRVSLPGGLRRATLVYWVCLAGALAGLALVLLAAHGAFEVPTGNVEYRSHTYMAALDRFRDSPVWGTLFAVEAVEKFTLYSIGISRNLLATHSDVLDLLANGGIAAILLWLYGHVRIAKAAYETLLRPEFAGSRWSADAHTLAVMALAAMITYAFNPILLQPALGYLVWTNLGLLAGLALRLRHAGAEAAAAQPTRPAYETAFDWGDARSRT